MKIKPGYIVKKVMGSYMIVATNGEESTMQTMNETGAFLWEALSKGATEEELLEKVLAEYDIDPDTAKSDIEAFVEKLKSANLLDE